MARRSGDVRFRDVEARLDDVFRIVAMRRAHEDQAALSVHLIQVSLTGFLNIFALQFVGTFRLDDGGAVDVHRVDDLRACKHRGSASIRLRELFRELSLAQVHQHAARLVRRALEGEQHMKEGHRFS